MVNNDDELGLVDFMCENVVRTNENARMAYVLCEKCECIHGEQRRRSVIGRFLVRKSCSIQ